MIVFFSLPRQSTKRKEEGREGGRKGEREGEREVGRKGEREGGREEEMDGWMKKAMLISRYFTKRNQKGSLEGYSREIIK